MSDPKILPFLKPDDAGEVDLSAGLGPGSDLQVVLAAWHEATDRLQQTHETLRDEVSRLTDELEIKNRELARKNRLADLGQMASHVAHEVRNGLAPLTFYLSLLRRRAGTNDGLLALLNKVDACFTAVQSTVSDLLSFTSDREPSFRTFDVAELITEVCESLAPQLSAQRIRVDYGLSAGIFVYADRDMLRRALMNLLLNAVDVMPTGGVLSIATCDTGSGVDIEVADSGPGIENEPTKIFEPFFTTKGDGTGLGLSIVQRIADAHGGDVTATNCPEGGAAFTIYLPSRQVEAAA
ncbi:MAG: two-component sensor histidine kinase [Planctomycetaceae bacterium]|nr:two-component sensor histidine kinase [Planctomycetaceae bacterium]